MAVGARSPSSPPCVMTGSMRRVSSGAQSTARSSWPISSSSWSRPYSPDLNPIEQVFAKLKHSLRKAQARSIDEIHNALGPILERFEPQECTAYLVNSGYAST